MRYLLAVLLALAAVNAVADQKVVFQKRSLYRNISVTEGDGMVCLEFTTRRSHTWQSCQRQSDPDRLVFDYTRMVFAGLALDPHPRRVLVIGLGGGSIPRTMHGLYPDARIDVAEIDPAVRDVARDYFDFHAAGPLAVHIGDGRVFVRRALAKGAHYDFIVLDAFNGDYIPEHLMTREFLLECRRLLSADGVLVANTFSSSKLYDSESATYQAAFGWFINLRKPDSNRVIVAAKRDRVSVARFNTLAQAIPADLAHYGIDMREITGLALAKPDWDSGARVLTDQYAPANLLNGPH